MWECDHGNSPAGTGGYGSGHLGRRRCQPRWRCTGPPNGPPTRFPRSSPGRALRSAAILGASAGPRIAGNTGCHGQDREAELQDDSAQGDAYQVGRSPRSRASVPGGRSAVAVLPAISPPRDRGNGHLYACRGHGPRRWPVSRWRHSSTKGPESWPAELRSTPGDSCPMAFMIALAFLEAASIDRGIHCSSRKISTPSCRDKSSIRRATGSRLKCPPLANPAGPARRTRPEPSSWGFQLVGHVPVHPWDQFPRKSGRLNLYACTRCGEPALALRNRRNKTKRSWRPRTRCASRVSPRASMTPPTFHPLPGMTAFR